MATKRGGKWTRLSMTAHRQHRHQDFRRERPDGRPREEYRSDDGCECGSRVLPMSGEPTNCLCMV